MVCKSKGRQGPLPSGVILYLQTVSRCQINSFLSFQFKKIQEPAKNPFYLVLLMQCLLDKCVLFGMEFYAISWIFV